LTAAAVDALGDCEEVAGRALAGLAERAYVFTKAGDASTPAAAGSARG
jgi:hypothetical protein